MNSVQLIGRLTRDPEIRYTEGAQPMAFARYTLAVDRKYKKEGGQQADFLSIVAFGKTAEFVEKYIKKGIKVIVECHAQSGSYEKDGKKVYYTEFVADAHEFCESKGNNNDNAGGQQVDSDGFMNIPDGVAEELPFN